MRITPYFITVLLWIGWLFIGLIQTVGDIIMDMDNTTGININIIKDIFRNNAKKIIITEGIITVLIWGMYYWLLISK